MDKIYLTTQEVADLIGLQPTTIYWRRKSGKFPPARKIGKNLLYKREEVIEWVEGCKEPDGIPDRKIKGKKQ